MISLRSLVRVFGRPEHKFLRDSVVTVSFQFVTLIISMLGGIVIARALGPSGRGVYGLITVIFGILVLLGALGVHNSHVYFLGKGLFALHELVACALLSTSLLSGAALVLFAAFYSLAPALVLHGDYTLLIFATLAFVPLAVLRLHVRYLYLGLQKVIVFNLLGLGELILSLVGLFLLLVLFEFGLGGALISFTGSIAIVAAMSTVLLFRQQRLSLRRLKFRRDLLKQALGFGAKTGLAGVMQLLNLRLDFFLVGFFLTAADLGVYAVAAALTNIVLQISAGIGLVLYPKVASSTTRLANTISSKVSRTIVFLTFLQGLVLLVAGRFVIQLLYGAQFVHAWEPLLLLLPGTVGMAVMRILFSHLAGRGRPEISTYSTLISLVVTIALDLMLIPTWGIAGAAFASSAAYLVGAVLPVSAFLKSSNARLLDLLMIKRSDVIDYVSLVHRIREGMA